MLKFMFECALQMLTVRSRWQYWEREILMFAFYSPEFLPNCVMLQRLFWQKRLIHIKADDSDSFYSTI